MDDKINKTFCLNEQEKKFYLFCSEAFGFVWYDIPKVGSTSIRCILKTLSPDLKSVGASKHTTLIDEKKFLEIQNSAFSFCFSRNPWSRLISNFFMFQKPNECRAKPLHDAYFKQYSISYLEEIDSFYSFCMNLDKIMNCGSESDLTPNKYKLRPQNHMICQFDFLAKAPDFIGRFENFQEDFNVVCDKIGIPRRQLPHENKSNHKHYTEYYDDETKQIVSEKYAKDIEYFGYKFGD